MRLNTVRVSIGLLTAIVFGMAGCGGNSGSGATPTTVSGTASQGAPLAVDTVVTLKDAKGIIATSTVKANGMYSIVVDGKTAPFVVNSGGIYSFASAPGVTNINPFTHLCMQLALGTSTITASTVIPANFQTQFLSAVTDLKAKTDALYPSSVSATQKDFLAGNISIATGVDKIFDSMVIVPPDASGNFSIAIGSQPILSGATSNGMVTITPNATTIASVSNLTFPASYTSKVFDYSTSSAGVPIAGVTVTTVGITPAITTTTDSNGLFVLANIPLNTPFYIKMSKATYADTYSNTFSLTANMNTSDRPYAQYLPTKLTSLGNNAGNGIIRGRAAADTDPVNGLISGATITATDQANGTAYQVRYSDNPSSTLTKTDTGGLYIIVNIPAGHTVNVTATRYGYTFNTRSFTAFADSICQARVVGTAAPVTLDGHYSDSNLSADGFTHVDSYDISGNVVTGVHSFSNGNGTLTGSFTINGTITLNTGAVSGNVVINNLGVRNTTFTGTAKIDEFGVPRFYWGTNDPTFGGIGGGGTR